MFEGMYHTAPNDLANALTWRASGEKGARVSVKKIYGQEMGGDGWIDACWYS